MRTAIITGASQGLGRALADALSRTGWRVVADARTGADLASAAAGWPGAVPLAGDVTDPEHRADLVTAAGDRVDLLVLNASALGPAPLPRLADYDLEALRRVLETNTVAPLGLVRLALPALRRAGGRVLAISSDAAVEAYPGWGGYGASKAALDLLTRVLAAEEPTVRAYAVDPGDLRTAMHAAAVPDADPAELADPADVVPALRQLIDGDLPSGRYTAAALAATALPATAPGAAAPGAALPAAAPGVALPAAGSGAAGPGVAGPGAAAAGVAGPGAALPATAPGAAGPGAALPAAGSGAAGGVAGAGVAVAGVAGPGVAGPGGAVAG
jgi:NAD(P)-dependent dehydrogenase (short-subunit alcohol dehydrogenase family)